MTCLRFWLARWSLARALALSLGVALSWFASAAQAQGAAPPGPGRQRLALVVGIGTLGVHQAIDSAPRDTQAMAAALRATGFVVMLREDIVGADLRKALAEFQGRLRTGGIGLLYFTGLGAQVGGQNLVLPRDVALDGPASGLAARLKARAVPLQELVDALQGTRDSPRLLVVDAAYRHPVLAALPKAGLAEQDLPPGMMAIFSTALGAVQEVPAVAPLPEPPPSDPREVAATRFARVLVGALTTPHISGVDALRTTQRAIADAAGVQATPWLRGETRAQGEFAEAVLINAPPRPPGAGAREAAPQAPRNTGEQSVDEILGQSPTRAPAQPNPPARSDAAAAPAPGSAPPSRGVP
jgi:hypothetical protein